LSYPAIAEVKDYALGSGYVLDAGSEAALAGFLASAIAEFEKRAGWIYFTPSGSGTVLYHSCDGTNDLWLDCGIITLGGMTVDGVAMTEKTDFELWPYNRSPKKRIMFRGIPSCNPRGIAVTANWGYAADVPAPVALGIKDACLAMLAERAASLLSAASGGDVNRLKQGPVEISFQSESKGDVYEMAPSFCRAVSLYKFREF
jgi:hypothetical protein